MNGFRSTSKKQKRAVVVVVVVRSVGYHAEEVAGVEVAGGRAPPQEPVRRIRPPPRGHGDGRRRRTRQHRGVRREIAEPPAPACRPTQEEEKHRLSTGGDADGQNQQRRNGAREQRHAMLATHGSAAAARSAGHPARAASPANTASTRSSGRQSNAPTATPRWPPDTAAFCFAGSVATLRLPPPQLPCLLGPLLVVGFLMAAGRPEGPGAGHPVRRGAERWRGPVDVRATRRGRILSLYI